jgi:hypothetical protein
MIIFTPEIGENITNTLNNAWGTNFDGIFIWLFGMLLAMFLD